MKKMAFFVEGSTEQLFISKYISEIYDKKSIAITSKKGYGGGKNPISFNVISADSITDDVKFCVLIYNCRGETNIRSYIENQRKSLAKQGYTRIIGIRDLFPNVEFKDLQKLIYGLKYYLPQSDISTDFIISVMEIEAYFLCEHKHFSKVHPNLNAQLIANHLPFNPETYNVEQLSNPAKDLHDCYQLVGESYTKEYENLERTINSLNYVELYFTYSEKYKALGLLKKELDDFFNV